MAPRLIKIAAKRSEQNTAAQKIAKHADQIDRYEVLLRSSLTSDQALQAHGELMGLMTDLEKRRRQLASTDTIGSQKARALEVRAKKLQTALQRVLSHPEQETARRRKSAKQSGTLTSSEVDEARRRESPPSIREVLAEAGWEIGPDTAALIEIIQDGLESILPCDGEHYRRFIEYVAERLADDTEE
jgi:hypothetical protein